MPILVQVTARDPNEGMTLDEVQAFVEQARQHADAAQRVKARVGMRGQLKSLETR